VKYIREETPTEQEYRIVELGEIMQHNIILCVSTQVKKKQIKCEE